jgi:hypothetical protein
VHILRPGAIGLLPLCKSKPFPDGTIVVRGVGLLPDHHVCQKCVQAAPSPILRAVRKERADLR